MSGGRPAAIVGLFVRRDRRGVVIPDHALLTEETADACRESGAGFNRPVIALRRIPSKPAGPPG